MIYIAKKQSTQLLWTVAVFTIMGGILTTGCQKSETKPATAGNDQRWTKFQEDAKSQIETSQSAYQKRQEQLAAKRNGKAPTSSGSPSTAPTTAPSTAPTTAATVAPTTSTK